MLARARTERQFTHITEVDRKEAFLRVACYSLATEVSAGDSVAKEMLLASVHRGSRIHGWVELAGSPLYEAFGAERRVKSRVGQSSDFSFDVKVSFWLSVGIGFLSVFLSLIGVVAEDWHSAFAGAVLMAVAAVLTVYWVEEARGQRTRLDN